MTELFYASIWLTLLVLIWHPVALVAWVVWTVLPFVLAGVE